MQILHGPPSLEYSNLSGLRDRLQLLDDCWTLLDLTDVTSFYRDALRTYAGMLSRLACQELPDFLTRVASDVDSQGTLRKCGGDSAADRIVPDAMRALAAGERNPATTRPWQHVLEAALQHWAGSWRDGSDPHASHEAGRLHLQIDKAHHRLGWQPRWRAPARMGKRS